MIKINLLIILFSLILCSCKQDKKTESLPDSTIKTEVLSLDLEEANRLAELPLKCISNPLPYKSGIVITKESDLKMPIVHHPAFYGCFDWHSAVHGHWSLIYLMKRFEDLQHQDSIRSVIDQNLSAENILKEIEYFSLNKYSKSFERTYGWAWLLKLTEELYTWDDPQGKDWYNRLKPLADSISNKYLDYLPKLAYPIRVGEHTNTAFGLSFAYDYAVTCKDQKLQKIIEKKAKAFYLKDNGCPINWEPSGYDFLSPCLQELEIMHKVLDAEAFAEWSNNFITGINDNFILEPGKVIDRSDGKLVHLDGLNFSRAWNLYELKNEFPHLLALANEHMNYSLKKIKDGDYAGEHWLASFALYAYKTAEE